MTNRARSTLKALQLLGNSVCGLSWANWRKVYNAIILLILTYTAPVWFSGQAGLLRQLCTAQNAAVRHIAGAFTTTPIDLLHQLLGIMPIDLRLQLLIKNVSLRLYKIPISSQLAARVPGPWGPRICGLIPLPIQPRQRPCRSSLLSLVENLPNTPYIDLLAARANTIEDLISKPDHLTIFAWGSKANHNRDDEQQPAICIAAAFSNQAEKDHYILIPQFHSSNYYVIENKVFSKKRKKERQPKCVM